MKIATWNVNSVRAHLAAVTAWLQQAKPDAVCLQEIKTVEDGFPREAFEDLGYNAVVFGQKSYNGVAILSRRPPEDAISGLPGFADEQARYIEALIPGEKGMLRLASLYAPNGNPAGTDKFAYKLDWMAALHAHARERLAEEEPLIFAGDYNVIPADADCYDPALWATDALGRPESKAAFRRLCHLGLADLFRSRVAAPGQYSFWDYQGGAWQKNLGLRIDFLLASPQALDRLENAGIDRNVRGEPKPSDHVPVWCEVDV